jgi:hypothetical protein
MDYGIEYREIWIALSVLRGLRTQLKVLVLLARSLVKICHINYV